MAELLACGPQSDDVNTALSILMTEYVGEMNVDLPTEKQYDLLLFARYVLDHWQRMAELLRRARQ